MKRLHIQLQPGRSPGLDAESVVARLQALATATVSRGEDGGSYINVDFCPADLRSLWAAVRELIRTEPGLAAGSNRVLQGRAELGRLSAAPPLRPGGAPRRRKVASNQSLPMTGTVASCRLTSVGQLGRQCPLSRS